MSPVQRLIARELLKLSSDAITPTELYRDQLLNWNAGSRISRMPVFSNVGEPGFGIPPGGRAAAAVVFGLSGVEDRLLGIYRPQIERLVPILGIERIFDIGPRASPVPTSLAGVPIISKGTLTPAAVSDLLQRVRFGLAAYPFDVLGKSGVFAAYAAHGVIPVVFPDRRGLFDGLEAGRHFLDGLRVDAAVDDDTLASLQRLLFTWYTAHSLEAQARFLKQSLRRENGSP